jgi:hypothetical protein
MRHLRGSNIEEHVYPGAPHEVLNEINRDEGLECGSLLTPGAGALARCVRLGVVTRAGRQRISPDQPDRLSQTD